MAYRPDGLDNPLSINGPNRECRECRCCGRMLEIAEDETDTPPSADEVILDAAGETTERDYYVCGACWESVAV